MLIALVLTASAPAADLAVRASLLHTVAEAPLRDATLLITDGRVEQIGPSSEVEIPDGVPVLDAAVVTPGFVDGLSTAGLTGTHNQPPDQDHSEGAGPIQPSLRALDGWDGWEPLVAWQRDHGVTTLQVGPSPGAVVGGRTLVASASAGSADQAALIADAMVVFTLGDAAKRRFAGQGTASRMGAAALIRQTLTEARGYAERRRLSLADRPPQDLGMDALVDVLAGERRALFLAHRADDLLTAVRIAEEFELDLVLGGAAEAYLVRDALAAAEVPVLLGPVMARSRPPGERENASFENAALLVDAGVPVGFMSGYEGYVPKVRVILWEAAIAATNGLGPERTLRALTRDAATILGVADQVGTLEVGKRADLVLFDGDPFEYTSHVCGVVVGGVPLSDTCR